MGGIEDHSIKTFTLVGVLKKVVERANMLV